LPPRELSRQAVRDMFLLLTSIGKDWGSEVQSGGLSRICHIVAHFLLITGSLAAGDIVVST
jgi:hypothetical protein